MSKMIERVAQAICGDDNPENILAVHRHRARKAIEAMRDPTNDMMKAAQATNNRYTIDKWKAMIDSALEIV